MTLRNTVLGLALLGVAIGLLVFVQVPAAWPVLVLPGLIVAGLVFERSRYRGNATEAAPDAWCATQERFRDDASGRVVTVWFNATTGERRYIEE